MSDQVPRGFRLAGGHCGIKGDPKEDLTLIVTNEPAVAAGVYTQNIVVAPSVQRNRAITPTDGCRGVVINSANANTCTGERGKLDNQRIAELAANGIGAQPGQILVMSTGIIGEYLPMDRITSGIQHLSENLGDDDHALLSAALGMITTDKSHKLAHRTLSLAGNETQITGLAKGAGMIGPQMATMLSVVMTDAGLSPTDAQAGNRCLRARTGRSRR